MILEETVSLVSRYSLLLPGLLYIFTTEHTEQTPLSEEVNG